LILGGLFPPRDLAGYLSCHRHGLSSGCA
jgi:hypothetical protein